jgi:hypothetical protein
MYKTRAELRLVAAILGFTNEDYTIEEKSRDHWWQFWIPKIYWIGYLTNSGRMKNISLKGTRLKENMPPL